MSAMYVAASAHCRISCILVNKVQICQTRLSQSLGEAASGNHFRCHPSCLQWTGPLGTPEGHVANELLMSAHASRQHGYDSRFLRGGASEKKRRVIESQEGSSKASVSHKYNTAGTSEVPLCRTWQRVIHMTSIFTNLQDDIFICPFIC